MIEKRKIAAISGAKRTKKGRVRRGKAKAEEPTTKELESTADLGKDADLPELQQKMAELQPKIVVEEGESKDTMEKAQLHLENVNPPQSDAHVDGDSVVKAKAEKPTTKELESTADFGKDADLSELQPKIVVEEGESKDTMEKAQLHLENVNPPQSDAHVDGDSVVIDEAKTPARTTGLLGRFFSRLRKVAKKTEPTTSGASDTR